MAALKNERISFLLVRPRSLEHHFLYAMYIAGIHVSDERLAFGTEGVVTSALFIFTTASVYAQRKAFKFADEKGGPIKSMPTTLLGKLATPLHAIAISLPVVTYLIAVPLNGGVQPAFIARWAMPDFGLSKDTVSILRVAGSVGLAGVWRVITRCLDLLGQSVHVVGVREKPKIVTTGLYALVRHPLYVAALSLELLLAVMFWNYVPLYAFAVCAFAFAVKIPVEESLIESNAEIGPDYKEYKKKVTYRLIPGLW